MALVKCGECGHEITKSAPSCPKCGAPRKAQQRTGCFTWVVTIFVIFLAVGVILSTIEQARQEEQAGETARAAATTRQAALADFIRNPEPTLARAREFSASGQWATVVSVLQPFLSANNAEARLLHDAALERKLVAELARVPAADARRNFDGYQQLATLNPDNATYAQKRDRYKARWHEQQRREAAENPSPWPYTDTLSLGRQLPRSLPAPGSHRPRSREHRVRRLHRHLQTEERLARWLPVPRQERLRGKILTANWFRIQRSRVVHVYDAGEFKWPGE